MPKSRGTTWAVVVAAVVIVVALGGYGVYAGWVPGTGNHSKASYTPPCAALNAAGSTFVYPLMNLWTTNYASLTGNCVQVNYQGIGSGAGISELTQKVIAFGGSDAPLTPSQTSGLPAKALTIPESAGAVSIMYNVPGVKTGLNLTGQVIAAIYLGSITNWNVTQITGLNPGVHIPNQGINPIYRSDGSGTTYAFTSFLAASNSTWAHTVGASTAVKFPTGTGAKGSYGVTGAVASTAGGISYAELNYAKGANVPYAAVQNPQGKFIVPTINNTQAAVNGAVASLPAPSGNWSGVSIINQPGAATYPVATFTYVLVYIDLGAVYGSSMTHAQAQALVSFLWWAVHDGQAQSAGLLYVPLPASLVALDVTAINEIVYNGAALQSH